MGMTLTNWISIAGILITVFLGFYFSFKKGDLRQTKIYVTPSRLNKGLAQLKFFKNLKRKVQAVGVMNFFLLPNSKHKKICYHIFITIENPTKYHIEDATLVLLYPRHLCDENDKQFFKPTGSLSKGEPEVVFIDERTVQVSYAYTSLHPKSAYQIIHPIIINIEECFKQIDVEEELYLYTQAKDFSFYVINYMVTAKNLKSPVRSHFWLINVIGIDQNKFFNREKKFLHTITKDFKFKRYFFEKRGISKYKEGKTKKDVLVVETNDLNIGYSSFPPLKEPFSGTFNFETV